MTQADDPASIAMEALRQKALARSNRSRRNIRMLGGFLAGFLVCGLAINATGIPHWSAANMFMLCVCIGAFSGAVATARMRFAAACCPVCAYDWNIKEGRSVPIRDRMEGWDKCPGCGLHMADWALERAAAGGRPL
jgi:hypothetical protein